MGAVGAFHTEDTRTASSVCPLVKGSLLSIFPGLGGDCGSVVGTDCGPARPISVCLQDAWWVSRTVGVTGLSQGVTLTFSHGWLPEQSRWSVCEEKEEEEEEGRG